MTATGDGAAGVDGARDGAGVAATRGDGPPGVIPGEILPGAGEITLNPGRPVRTLPVANTGDRPVQVGSHYHFAEANPALDFDRAAAWGHRLAVPAGTSVRFEPGIRRDVDLVPLAGARVVPGLRGDCAGPLDTCADPSDSHADPSETADPPADRARGGGGALNGHRTSAEDPTDPRSTR